MRNTIVCFGEALIDFLNTSHEKHGEQTLNHFVQFPGGAPANVAVATAKLGAEVKFLGQVGNDPFGKFLIESLQQYGVDTQYTFLHSTAKTPLAFVFLDETGDRSFDFFRENTADLLLTESQLDDAIFNTCSVFHFCSNTLTTSAIKQTTQAAADKALQNAATLSFDVNLRHDLWAENQADKRAVNECVFSSHVIKFSQEEFDYLCTETKDQYLSQCFAANVKIILITDGGEPVSVITEKFRFDVPIPDVDVVDTTAGGDAFSGAIVFGLQHHAIDDLLVSQDKLSSLVSFAVSCGAHAVSRQGAFPALPTMQDVAAHWE